jgi:hypothetical protein
MVVGATYRATIKGGPGGAADANHNPLVADKTWTFTTSAVANTAPTATITAPSSSLHWKVGDVISFAGTGTDAQDGNLPASALHWDVLLHHCIDGACHIHPLVTATGPTGSFTVPDHGDQSYFEIKLTVTDSGYLTSTTSVNVNPTTVQLTLDTAPSGLTVVYDGTLGQGPLTKTTIVGSTHTITAPSPQTDAANVWNGFVSWSDGGAAQHNVTLGAQDTTYTATFGNAFGATYTGSPPTSWQVGQTQTYNVTVKNTGVSTWAAGGNNPVHLGIHFGDASDACCTWATDERFMLPNDVPPNGTATLAVQVTAPTTAGSYVLRAQMVAEQLAWFDQIQKTNVTVSSGPVATSTFTPTPTQTSTSTVVATSTPTRTGTPTFTPTPSGAALAAEYTSTPLTGWLPGQTQVYSVTVKNTGTETWLANGTNRTRLGIHFGDASDGCCAWATDQRFALSADLAPGASQSFSVAVTAPTTAGAYVLRHQMVKEGVAWFSQIQKTNVSVGTLAASYASSPPTAWQPGVPRTVPVTVTNTGTQTWVVAEPNPVHLSVTFGGASDACCSWATDQRVILPNDLPAGASVTLNVQVIPPTTTGSYVLRNRMVKENVAWFDQLQKVDVTVGTPAATPTSTSVATATTVPATATSVPTSTAVPPTATPIPTATPVPPTPTPSGPALAAQYSSSPPTSWIGGQTQTYAITVTNVGSETWPASGTDRVRLGVHFGGASDACCNWATDERFALPNDLPPGGSYTYTINVTAPSTGGPYVLRQQMVKENVAWFSQIHKTNVTVGTLAAAYSASPPTTWRFGVPQVYAISITNTGTLPWNANEPYPVHLSVHFGGTSDACCNWATDQRFMLPGDVQPGQTITMNVQIVPPNSSGVYVLRNRLVKEYVAWFDQILKTNVTVFPGGFGQRGVSPQNGTQNLAPMVQSSPTPPRPRPDGPAR